MSYQLALEKAGAKVLAFEEFGSYQGEWFALVNYNGQLGIIEGYYGSCSGCDAFQSEFDYDSDPKDLDCRLAKFGETYLLDIQPKYLIEQRLNILKSKSNDDDYFDQESKEQLEWCLKQFDII